MSEFSQGLPSVSSPSKLVKMPEYRITRRADQSLAFDPPPGSRELANALSMKYPLCESLEQQLQEALLDFINKEDASHEYTFTPSRDHRQSLSSASATTAESPSFKIPAPNIAQTDFKSSLSVWSITTGKPVEKKRNRIRYNTEKRVKVAGVRKLGACEYHRKKKTECTCNTSPTSQESPAKRRRSLTESTNEESFHSSPPEVTSVVKHEPEVHVRDSDIAFDADLFNANLPQLYDSGFNSNFTFWGPSTLPPTIEPATSFTTDTNAELSIYTSSPADLWHQDRPW